MKEIVRHFWPGVNEQQVYIFLLGIFVGLVIIFVLFLVLGVLYLIIRNSKKIRGITLSAPHGTLFIAASAIADLVRSLESEFNELRILKIYLVSEKKLPVLRVKLVYAPGGHSMMDLAEQFQARTLAILKDSFGIENIQRIDLIVPKGTGRIR